MHKKRKLFTRQVGVMFSPASYESIEFFASKEGLSVSEFIRNTTMERLEQYLIKEKELLENMDDEMLTRLLTDLATYLKRWLSKDERGQYICKHSHYIKHQNAKNGELGERYEHTINFCREVNVLFSLFLKKIVGYVGSNLDCDCAILNELCEKEN